MSRRCRDIAFFFSSLSNPFLMSRHCSSGVVPFSFDVLRDVTAYVVMMLQHCSFALPVSTDVAAMS